MFEIGATLFLITKVQYALGAPMQLKVSTPKNAQTDEEEVTDTTTLPAVLGTMCTLVATAVAVFTLYIKCRQHDGPIGACCSKLHDIALCIPCGMNKVMSTCCLFLYDLVLCIHCRENEYQTENDVLYERIGCASSKIVRIVLIGKSGSGKSETGNALLGHEQFRADITASSVTQCCECKEGTFLGQKVLVTDTPGIFDPTAKISDTQAEIARFIDLTLPGPHILLFVLRIGRFTQEDNDTLSKFKDQFGGAVEDYLVVVFTHFDELKKRKKTKNDFIESAKTSIPLLKNLKNRFVFLEHYPVDPKTDKGIQMRKLLDVVQNVQIENKDTCYSNVMYEARLAEIQEQQRKEEEERKEKKRKKEEDRNRALEMAIMDAKQEGQKEMREMLEQNTKVLKQCMIDQESTFKAQKAILEKQGQQVLKHNEMHSKTMRAFLYALVYKLDEKVVCGIVLTNKTKHRLCSPEIKLSSFGGGKIFLDPTIDSIDENDVCMMVACKTTGFRGTKGLLTWDIDGKDHKIGIMWSVPYWSEPNRLALGFPCSNDAQTQDDMYNKEAGDKYCKREFKTSENRIEMRYHGLVISGFMRSDRHTIVEVQLNPET